ncbi:iron donor protein CyaY [Hypericibacter adhaerens]|nr:iron donor protein CyaY [Hypericibacter adhaerens]
MPPMDETSFERAAEKTLQQLMTALEEALGDEAEVDLQGGILTVELETGGTYLFNMHRPNRQIWLSSPRSGAWHFDADPRAPGQWVATKGGERLQDLLARELNTTLAFD